MADTVTSLGIGSLPAPNPPQSLFQELEFVASEQGEQTIVPGVDGARLELFGWDFVSKGVNVANFGDLGYIVLDEGTHSQRIPGDAAIYSTEPGQGLNVYLGCPAEISGKVFYREVRNG